MADTDTPWEADGDDGQLRWLGGLVGLGVALLVGTAAAVDLKGEALVAFGAIAALAGMFAMVTLFRHAPLPRRRWLAVANLDIAAIREVADEFVLERDWPEPQLASRAGRKALRLLIRRVSRREPPLALRIEASHKGVVVCTKLLPSQRAREDIDALFAKLRVVNEIAAAARR